MTTTLLLANAGSFLGNPMILMLAMFLMMYVLMIRPQQKRQKELQAQINALKQNDAVVTISGIHGTVVGIGEKTIKLKVDENTRIEFDKSAIARVGS